MRRGTTSNTDRRVSPAARALVCAVLVLGAACSSSTAVERDLAAAKRRWSVTAPAAYQITVAPSCFCPSEVTRPATLTVRDGQVESRRYVDTGADVDPRYATSFPSVDGLFAIIDAAVARGAARVEATYDATRGYPISIAIDYLFQVADDESFYGASDFKVR